MFRGERSQPLSTVGFAFGVATAAVLAAFAARRLLLVSASLLPPMPLVATKVLPTLTLLVPARNEEAVIGRLLDALDELEYPRERLSIVLVDDKSEDRTVRLFRRWAEERAWVEVVELPEPLGKPEALNRGLAAAQLGELVVVCDADLRPDRAALARLAAAFGDPRVGAVAGYRRPTNARLNLISRYAAVESWVHQLVTSAGKDRLGLNPPVLGFGGYRRAALEEIGWFRSSARAEDIDTSVALTDAGWRTRFEPAAVADNPVVYRWRDYWHQHARWSSTLLEAARPARRRSPALPHRLERWLMAAGYADRVALAAAVALAGASLLPVWLAPSYLALAAVEMLVALRKARVPFAHGLRCLAATVAFFPVDVGASAVALAAHPVVARRRSRAVPGWRTPDRRIADASTRPSVPVEE